MEAKGSESRRGARVWMLAGPCDLLVLLRGQVLSQHIAAEVTVEVTPTRVDVIGVSLSVIRTRSRS